MINERILPNPFKPQDTDDTIDAVLAAVAAELTDNDPLPLFLGDAFLRKLEAELCGTASS